MPKRSSKKPAKDLNQSAHSIVAALTAKHDATVEPEPPRVKNPAAMALGKLGGLKGGKARAASMSPERRSEIAKQGAAKRWGKKKPD